jgi:ribosome-associated heat shock protein Hsp15
MNPASEVRIDKWLWAVRLYKTRTVAAEACKAGHVKVGGQPIKPSRDIRLGETIEAKTGEITRTVRVLGLVEQRIGAKLVSQYLEDLTPASEYEKLRLPSFRPLFWRPKGSGRPSKKQRRDWESLFS